MTINRYERKYVVLIDEDRTLLVDEQSFADQHNDPHDFFPRPNKARYVRTVTMAGDGVHTLPEIFSDIEL